MRRSKRQQERPGKPGTCIHRLAWISDKAVVLRDPAPNDPDVHPVREPEPQPDTPEPEPGDEPERIDPVRTLNQPVVAQI